MRRTIILTSLIGIMVAGCATAPKNKEAKDVLSSQVDEAIALFKAHDPTIERFFNQSYGYAVFPKIGKGAFWVGGAFGRGEVFEQGNLVGYSSQSHVTLGFSFGGESFREIIFFRDKADLDKFKMEGYAFNAQLTAVALTAGAAAKADYKSGLAVFVMADKGLMVDASLGGEKFKYEPIVNNNP